MKVINKDFKIYSKSILECQINLYKRYKTYFKYSIFFVGETRVMTDKKDIKVYGLNKNRYMELKYFCMQYQEWIEEVKNINYDLQSYKIDGLPRSNNISKPIEKLAIRKVNLERKIKIIEQTAIEANAIIYQELLKNITQNVPYKYLNVSYSERQFYRIKNVFFNLLNEKTNF